MFHYCNDPTSHHHPQQAATSAITQLVNDHTAELLAYATREGCNKCR